MTEITKKEICKCTNCGNEAEMVVTCSLEDAAPPTESGNAENKEQTPKKIKGTATCSHCGNEADMWIEI